MKIPPWCGLKPLELKWKTNLNPLGVITALNKYSNKLVKAQLKFYSGTIGFLGRGLSAWHIWLLFFSAEMLQICQLLKTSPVIRSPHRSFLIRFSSTHFHSKPLIIFVSFFILFLILWYCYGAESITSYFIFCFLAEPGGAVPAWTPQWFQRMLLPPPCFTAVMKSNVSGQKVNHSFLSDYNISCCSFLRLQMCFCHFDQDILWYFSL